MLQNNEIRARARDVLGGEIFKNEWLYPVLIFLVISAINGLLSATLVGVVLVYGLVMCGVCEYTLLRVRGRIPHDSLGTVVDGAKKDLSGNLLTGLLVTLFTALWSLLFIIPGIVKSCSYAMAYYIKCDNPHYSATEAINESRRMMDGYKMKYFLLQLSFIGWIIVGALALGVGTLWVQAYMQTANAVFYEEIRSGRVEIKL